MRRSPLNWHALRERIRTFAARFRTVRSTLISRCGGAPRRLPHDRLREVIDEHGWPGHRLVGEEGAEHAWLLAQHADRQLDFQRRALSQLTDAVQRGDAAARHLAYIPDRVRVNEGREQVYGTQMRPTADRQAVPWPIEDAQYVDERRAAAGLEALPDYRAQFQTDDETKRPV